MPKYYRKCNLKKNEPNLSNDLIYTLTWILKWPQQFKLLCPLTSRQQNWFIASNCDCVFDLTKHHIPDTSLSLYCLPKSHRASLPVSCAISLRHTTRHCSVCSLIYFQAKCLFDRLNAESICQTERDGSDYLRKHTRDMSSLSSFRRLAPKTKPHVMHLLLDLCIQVHGPLRALMGSLSVRRAWGFLFGLILSAQWLAPMYEDVQMHWTELENVLPDLRRQDLPCGRVLCMFVHNDLGPID